MKIRITFIEENKTVFVEKGTNIREAAVQAGLSIETPCGGNGLCQKCWVRLEGRREKALACRTLCEEGMRIHLPQAEKEMQILSSFSEKHNLDKGTEKIRTYVAAFDIGTTTVAAYLLDKDSGCILRQKGSLNPQARHGADVISRIEFAVKGNGAVLTAEIRDTVDRMLESLLELEGISAEEIMTVAVAGNTCMHHLFLGIPVDSLVKIPYQPAVYEALTQKASDLGMHIHPEGRVLTFPNIAGFVGGDTTACLLAAEFEQREKMTLLIDIGTNGEMVLGNAQKRIACSTAAGPALEGARISCGMRGTTGAIDHVWSEQGKTAFSVLGDTEPEGLCGSGLLDAVAVLLELSVLDESGAFLTEEKEYRFSDRVCLTQRDVRELQLAKAAIAAGIRILCMHMEICLEDIEEVLIAGAFGNYMNPESACEIGMIPKLLKNRIKMIGNAAGAGSCQLACSERAFEAAEKLAMETEFLELASDSDFQDIFVEELSFESYRG